MSTVVDRLLGRDRTIIPHPCKTCGTGLYFKEDVGDKNYTYWKGDYYCTTCFGNKPHRGRRSG